MVEAKPGHISLETALHKKGLSNLGITAGLAVVSGAREVRAIHGASPQDLQIVYKVTEGMTPRTVADLRSGEAGKAVLFERIPGVEVNEEETGITPGKGYLVYYDPLDGTSSFARGKRYSTVGMEIRRKESSRPIAAAVVHPFEQELLVAE